MRPLYLVPIRVPIFVDGPRLLVASDWHRSLQLLRDSLPSELGALSVLAPSLPVGANDSGQTLVEVAPAPDGIALTPSFDLRVSTREFWASAHRRWTADLDRLVPQATVVHAGVDELLRPINYGGLRAAWRHDVANVLVQDSDVPLRMRELARHRGWTARMRVRCYGALYDRACRAATRRASLSLLKGTWLMERYGRGARNAKVFHDTSFARADIVAPDVLERRIESLGQGRPLRLVYCGRLDPEKGVHDAVAIVARARELGARVGFDVIGEGDERARLAELASDPRLQGAVRLLGSRPYGPELLTELAHYDALLFTPVAEETPRMIFDGYAAGLPLLGREIEYVKERAQAEHATILLPMAGVEDGARAILALDRERPRLAALNRAARAAALEHCAEGWYARRAAWTLQAYEAHRAARRGPGGGPPSVPRIEAR